MEFCECIQVLKQIVEFESDAVQTIIILIYFLNSTIFESVYILCEIIAIVGIFFYFELKNFSFAYNPMSTVEEHKLERTFEVT